MPVSAYLAVLKNRILLLLSATMCLFPRPVLAQSGNAGLTTLHNFVGSDGANPAASLTQAGDGNFYGTTPSGGANAAGAVYRITTAGVLTTIYSFSAPNDSGINADGSTPTAALALGSDGALYGAAQAGGTAGFGTFFKITTDGSFTALYSFKATDGNNPVAAPVQGGDGNFYGTTLNGGTNAFGTVYRTTSAGVLTTIHSFAAGEGYAPSGALAQGGDGNFYGTTRYGGANGAGTAFQITPGGGFSTIFSFGASAGGNPTAALVRGSDGNLYGAAPSGGANGRGTVFKLTTGGAETTLHAFATPDNAAYPSGLVQASDGNLYGTASGGGSASRGALFRITTSGTFTNLYSFAGTSDGSYPQSALAQGSDGNLYGTTSSGGSQFDGTVFRFALVSHPPFFSGEVALSNGVYYLAFANGNIFGYYSYLSDPRYIYHQDLGFEYVFDAADGHSGVYLYDFKSGDFFYTSPTFPFPYLYDFTLKTSLYYYPDPANPQRYNTNGIRYFYNFSTGKIISR